MQLNHYGSTTRSADRDKRPEIEGLRQQLGRLLRLPVLSSGILCGRITDWRLLWSVPAPLQGQAPGQRPRQYPVHTSVQIA